MKIDEIDLWNTLNKSPLFHPENSGEHNRSCELCHALYELFEEKKRKNDGLFLFSHNILGWESME